MRLRPQPCANIVANGISAVRPEFALAPTKCARQHRQSVLLRQVATGLRSSLIRARTAAPSLAREYYALASASYTSRFAFIIENTTTTTTLTTLEIMGSGNNKRPAAASSTASSLSKKRKTDNMPKYYAVQAGFVPGVYLTYSECQAQTAGFKGAVCKLATLFPPGG